MNFAKSVTTHGMLLRHFWILIVPRKGTLTAEDDATYTRMEQDIADLGKEIARLERPGGTGGRAFQAGKHAAYF